eukprot:497097-Pyramimonas_sp.AAC.1
MGRTPPRATAIHAPLAGPQAWGPQPAPARSPRAPVRALDKEPLDRESSYWKPAEHWLRPGHVYHRRLHRTRNHSGS